MLQIFSLTSKQKRIVLEAEVTEKGALWYDIINPEPEEVLTVESKLGVKIPSRQAMNEIEESSRLYEEKGVLYMTAILLASADSGSPTVQPVSFILTPESLLTVRFAELKAFQLFEKKLNKNGWGTPQLIFLSLVDTIVERLADILEMNASEIDQLSADIFKNNQSHATRAMREVLIYVGKIGDLNSKVRESIITLDRLLIFYQNQLTEETDKKIVARIKTIQQDVKALVNYVTFLFGKIEFLLDATLGFIDIEQNGIIKFFSVAAVIFLPPMVIASIYGMNFSRIPELNWVWGYPFALVLMILSAILPYWYFKRKGWI